MLTEILILLRSFIEKLVQDTQTFSATLVFALLFSAGFWALCSFHSRLWNRHFIITATHHLLCATAAISTFLFTISFVALNYSGEVAASTVLGWQSSVSKDRPWQQKIFAKAYDAVKALNIEDFSDFPPPTKGGDVIPSKHAITKKKVASIYANEAVAHFNRTHSYLSQFLWANPEQSASVINRDLEAFFEKNPGENYDLSGAIELAAQHIQQELTEQIPSFVVMIKLSVIFLFMFIQAIPFGMIGYAAYNDLKIIT